MGRQNPREDLDTAVLGAFQSREAQLRLIAAKAGPDEAADILQDVVVRALQAGRQAPLANPIHFLARVTRNAVVDRLRTRSRHAQVWSAANREDAADPGASPERALIASERLRRAIAAIDAMPARRRQVFLLHRIEDLGYAQIARRLGISVKTVEKHIALAMDQLAREVDGYERRRR